MTLPAELRVNATTCDDAAVVSLLHRLGLVRRRMTGLRVAEDHGTSAMILGVENAAGTMRMNVVTETRYSGLAFFLSGTHEGARTDVRLRLTLPLDRNLAEDVHSDPREAERVLDLFEACAARPEARIAEDALPYRTSDPLGDALLAAVDGVADVASAAIAAENEHHRPYASLRVVPAGLGRDGRIVDHRSRRPLSAPVERALLSRLPDVVVLSSPTSHSYGLETAQWERPMTAPGAVAAMRTLAGSGLPTGRTTTSGGRAAD